MEGLQEKTRNGISPIDTEGQSSSVSNGEAVSLAKYFVGEGGASSALGGGSGAPPQSDGGVSNWRLLAICTFPILIAVVMMRGLYRSESQRIASHEALTKEIRELRESEALALSNFESQDIINDGLLKRIKKLEGAPEFVVVTRSAAKLLTKPDAKAKTLMVLEQGVRLPVLGHVGEFYKTQAPTGELVFISETSAKAE